MKRLLICLTAISLVVGIWFPILSLFDAMNPPYVILEDGGRGYHMNTGNMVTALAVSILVTLCAGMVGRKIIVEWLQR